MDNNATHFVVYELTFKMEIPFYQPFVDTSLTQVVSPYKSDATNGYYFCSQTERQARKAL